MSLIRRISGVLAACVMLAMPLPVLATALSITAANVLYVNGPKVDGVSAGEAFTAGAVVYKKSTDGKWYKALCTGNTDQAGGIDYGIALASADAAGAIISVALHGATVQIGAGTAGTVYFIGATAGSLVPAGDLATTNKATPVAIGIGTSPARVQVIGFGYNAGSVLP